MFSRARWRLTLWFAGAFAVIFVILGAAVYFTERASLMDNVNSDLQVRSERLVQSARGGGGLFDPGNRNVQFATAGGYFYRITGPGGTVSASESADQISLLTIDQLAGDTSGGAAYVRMTTNEGERLRVYVQPVQALGGQTVYFQVGRSIEPELHALRRLVFILGIGGLAGLWLAGMGGWWLAGRALKPIQASMDAQRTFVADASHELRTPLSLIRANAEIMKRSPDRPPDPEYVDDIIQETDRLSYLVGQMLTLARADSAGATFEKAPVDMSRLAQDMTRQMKLLASEKEIAMEAHTNGTAPVMGDEQRLGELLLILLDNSVKYTDRGGRVDVTVAQANGRVSIAVADNGKGIPPESIPRVFDRFYRADKARSREMGGSGLGLAIARWIADGHGGHVEIHSVPNQGTTVTVQLPAA